MIVPPNEDRLDESTKLGRRLDSIDVNRHAFFFASSLDRIERQCHENGARLGNLGVFGFFAHPELALVCFDAFPLGIRILLAEVSPRTRATAALILLLGTQGRDCVNGG